MDMEEDAIRLKGENVILDVPALAQSLGNVGLLEQIGQREWILRKNLYIDKGVTLVIDGEDVSWLKLRSGKTGFAWLKSQEGNILIRNTKITSWDEQAGDVDRDWSDGRSYILQKSNGRMDILGSEIAYLGYLGSPNRGNPFGGPYGVSWKITNGSFRDELTTGSIRKSRIHHNYFGVYTYGATGMVFSDNDVFENVEYGIDPHDDSNNLLIEGNRTYRNGKHGIITSKRCFANVIRKNHSYENGLHGIMLDRASDDNIVEDNVADRNVNGIALFGSSGNVVSGNRLVGNKYAIRVNGRSTGNIFSGNTIEAGEKGIFLYGDSSGNYLFENDFSNQRAAVHIKERSDSFLTEKAPVFEGVQASFTGIYLDE
jgi:parallel beta-helix repeat protein